MSAKGNTKHQDSTVARAFSSRWAREPKAAIGMSEILKVESLAAESPNLCSFLATTRICHVNHYILYLSSQFPNFKIWHLKIEDSATKIRFLWYTIYNQSGYQPDFQVFQDHSLWLLHQHQALKVVHHESEAFPVLQCFRRSKKLQSNVIKWMIRNIKHQQKNS